MYHSGLADVDDTHPAFHPPIAHRPPLPLPLILASLTIRRTRLHHHRALGLLELDDRFKGLVITARKGRKVYRKRMAGAQLDVYLESLRWRRVH